MPVPPGERPAYERNIAIVRGQLGAPTFAAASVVGQAMTLEQAIAYALEGSEADSMGSVRVAPSTQ
jgi:hypothetical protein